MIYLMIILNVSDFGALIFLCILASPFIIISLIATHYKRPPPYNKKIDKSLYYMNRLGIIYMAQNKQTKKIYIGQTVRGLDKRRREHEESALSRSSTTKFHIAIRKYGKSSFNWIILAHIEQDILNQIENHYINKFNSVREGYNSVYVSY